MNEIIDFSKEEDIETLSPSNEGEAFVISSKDNEKEEPKPEAELEKAEEPPKEAEEAVEGEKEPEPEEPKEDKKEDRALKQLKKLKKDKQDLMARIQELESHNQKLSEEYKKADTAAMEHYERSVKLQLEEAKRIIFERLDELATEKWEDAKAYLVNDMFEEVEVEDEVLDEAAKKRNPNIVKMGRIQKIRRRIRRNKKGKIIVQKNVRKSGVKGYRISGSTVKRIPAAARLKKARLLKRAWKTKRRAKLRRTLVKRKMSMRRRKSMGLR